MWQVLLPRMTRVILPRSLVTTQYKSTSNFLHVDVSPSYHNFLKPLARLPNIIERASVEGPFLQALRI